MHMNSFDLLTNRELWQMDEFDNIINDFDSLIEDAVNKNVIKDNLDYTNILLNIACKTIVTSRELSCLISYGFADGAMALARTIYEHFIVINYFDSIRSTADFEEHVKDYYLDYELTFAKYMKWSAEQIGAISDKNKYEEKLKSIKGRTRKTIKKKYWWADINSFSDLVELVKKLSDDKDITNLQIRAHMLYKQACLSLHSNCFGNMWRLKDNYENTHIIDTCPSFEGHGVPLELATLSLIFIVCLICKELGIDYSKLKNELNNLASYYVNNNNQKST